MSEQVPMPDDAPTGEVVAAQGRRRRLEPVLTAVADRLGISVGQAYTVVTGAVVAVALGLFGIPPVLDGAELAPAPASADLAAGDTGGAASAPLGDPQLQAELAVAFAPVLRGGLSSAFSSSPGSASPPVAPIQSGPLAPTSAPPTTAPLGSTSRFAAVPTPGAPAGIAVGPDGTVYVATGNAVTKGDPGPGQVLAFGPGGDLRHAWAIDGMPEPRARGLTDVAVDAAGSVWVLDASTARVLRIDPGAAAAVVVATVPDLPTCFLGLAQPPCEPGLADGAPDLRGLALRPDGGVYVADRVQATVWSVDGGGTVAPVLSIDDRIAGEGPVDLGVLADGSLVVTVSARLGSAPPGLPSVLRFRATGASFEPAVVVTDLGLQDAPEAVAVTASGRVWIALSGVNEVVDLGLEQGDQVRHGAGLDPAFDVPVGLALRDGSLLVTNQAAGGAEAARWAVLALAVADRPPTP